MEVRTKTFYIGVLGAKLIITIGGKEWEQILMEGEKCQSNKIKTLVFEALGPNKTHSHTGLTSTSSQMMEVYTIFTLGLVIAPWQWEESLLT